MKEFEGSGVIGKVPADGARFGITTGSKEEWARFATAVAKEESSFNPGTKNFSDPGGSFGVFQYAHGQVPGGNAFDTDASVKAFVRDAESSVNKPGGGLPAGYNIPGVGQAAGGSIRTGILGARFSTIGSHPDRAARSLMNMLPGTGGGGVTQTGGNVFPGIEPGATLPGAGSAAAPPPMGARTDIQTPGYYGGIMKVGDEEFHYGTGGRGRGATPYGTYPVNIAQREGVAGAVGQGILGNVGQRIGSVATVGGRGGEIDDPRYPGAQRGGIQIHPSSSGDLDRLYTAGCFGVPRAEWPRFKAALLREAERNPGGLMLNIDPKTNKATILPRGQGLGGTTQAPGSVPYLTGQESAATKIEGGWQDTYLDRKELDRNIGKEITSKVEGEGKVTVDVKSEKSDEDTGKSPLKDIPVKRQSQMQDTSDGPKTTVHKGANGNGKSNGGGEKSSGEHLAEAG